MEMERINDDVIKVLIAAEDLAARGVDFMELMGDHSRIEKFFYSILEEVDTEHQFKDSDSVTFQVIPSEGGLELYISRTGLTGMDEFLENEFLRRLLERRQASARERLTAPKQDKASMEELGDLVRELDDVMSEGTLAENEGPEVVRFETLEDFLTLARLLPSEQLSASLYHMEQHYYLVLGEVAEEMTAEEAYHHYLSMMEYAEPHGITEAVLAEYGQLIRAEDALSFFGNM